ncbi:hypothetical protein FA893_18290 [Photobacterium damselae subsp. piscicida]|uniref:hypothetical protein n=1 Tax=Photobacterium damselae TaxID=38293 RepID=UPI0002F48114|nr:hypothetical protein [Photobacterium damselae]OLQ78681.1 hypothetical protein BEI67_18945 [Photobacterium damselae subsp. piscicida]TFZ63937.1 hypothetical protein E4T25_01345 [Photobacterium damselae subsp. piscicida]TJZ82350.1 hypothetical protein FA893_18290 [Photobacterium damselae subsp. piscicida]
MKSFKEHMKQQAFNEMLTEASLLDVQNLFISPDVEIIEPEKASEHENLKRFRFTATTKKGTQIDMVMGLSELLHPSFVMNLQKLAIS